MHQRSRGLNACQVAQCRHGGHRHGPRDAAQGLEGLDHRSEAPGLPWRGACVFQTLEACGLCGNGLDVCRKDHGLRWGRTDHGTEPAEGGGTPGGPPGRADSVPQHEGVAPELGRFSSRRVSSRARRRSRIAASSTAGPYTGVRAPERMRRARCLASRRLVVTRSPTFVGIKAGATTQQTEPVCLRERESQSPQGPAA